jgi:hypothetical protein
MRDNRMAAFSNLANEPREEPEPERVGGWGKWSMGGVPHTGWECVDMEDLGEPSETCEMCEHAEVRYIHIMRNVGWPDELRVGCVCAARMEQNSEAAQLRERRFKKAVGEYRMEMQNAQQWAELWPKAAKQCKEQAERIAERMSGIMEGVQKEIEQRKLREKRKAALKVAYEEEAKRIKSWTDAADLMLGSWRIEGA